MAWADLNTIHNPATGTAPPATWGDGVRDNFQFLAGMAAAQVLTSQTTTSTSYTDLATAGPAVTVTTGTSALVIITAYLQNSGGNLTYASFAVSGATTSAATDDRLIAQTTANGMVCSRPQKITGLTAGSNTFTMKYRVAAGTGTYAYRDIVVIPLPV